jgi:hypothetical protein
MCGRYSAIPDRGEPQPEIRQLPSWTRAGVVRAIRAYAFFHDRPPSEVEWRAQRGSTWPTEAAVQQLFGSFGDALAAAGLEPQRGHRARV